ncbi:hypothetical protein Taro_002836, partial [Colocasia esculenta]|nr:hypothetical protein [Colocasia esculenta]
VRLLSSGRARAGRRRRGGSRDVVYSPSGSPDPWAATAKIGSSAWAEGRVLGSLQLVSELGLTGLVVDLNCNSKRSQARQLVEQQDESDMPAQGQVQEEVSMEESVAQPQGAQAAAAEEATVGGQQQQEYHPQPRQYADWFPMAEQFFRAMYQGEVEPEVEQPVRQQRSGTGSTRSGQRRAAVSEARTALLERFLRLRPPMFHGEYDPDKAESWTHELERIFETMECAEEDQVRLAVYQLKGAAHEWWRVQRQTHFQGQRLDQISWQQFSEVFHGEYFPDYARRERRDQFHELVQGDLTISQYHQRFVWLLRHVPHVVGSDHACAERFIAGLRPDLRWGVTAHMCTTLGEAVAKATALDREAWQPQQQQQQQQGGASSRSSPYQRPAGSRRSATSSSSGSGSSDSSGIRSQFRKLSTRGGGRSRQQRRQSRFAEQSVQQGAEQGSQEPVCYTCGLPGHFRRDCPRGQAPQQQQPVQYTQQPPQYQHPPQQQAPRQQQRGQYQQQVQQFPQPPQYQSYQQQQQFLQPQQAPQRGRGRGRLMALTREQAEASNLVIGVVFVRCGARRRRFYLREGPNGCVLRVEVGTSDSFALSMIPSPSRPCMISMLPSPVRSVSPVSGRFPEEESLEPPTGLKATHPVSPPV